MNKALNTIALLSATVAVIGTMSVAIAAQPYYVNGNAVSVGKDAKRVGVLTVQSKHELWIKTTTRQFCDHKRMANGNRAVVYISTESADGKVGCVKLDKDDVFALTDYLVRAQVDSGKVTPTATAAATSAATHAK